MSFMFTFHYDIFKQLLKAKLTNIRSELTEKIINIYIWAGCSIFVMGYLMQSFGLAQNFGVLLFAGILASVGLFEVYGNTAVLIADIEGDCKISYYLALPTLAPTVLASYVAHRVIITISMCLALIPLGIIMLYNQLNFATIAWGKLLTFLFLSNIMWAIMSLILAAYIKNIDKLGIAWCRIIFPLWFLGGYQYSWAVMHKVAPYLSYLMLLNPMIYATEGIRAAQLGQTGYLPFWICFVVMTALCGIFGWWAVKALRQRLDFV